LTTAVFSKAMLGVN